MDSPAQKTPETRFHKNRFFHYGFRNYRCKKNDNKFVAIRSGSSLVHIHFLLHSDYSRACITLLLSEIISRWVGDVSHTQTLHNVFFCLFFFDYDFLSAADQISLHPLKCIRLFFLFFLHLLLLAENHPKTILRRIIHHTI